MTIGIVQTGDMNTYLAEGPFKAVLADTDEVRARLLNLDVDQGVGPCLMSDTVVYYVIEGRGHLQVEDEKAELRTGSLVVVPAGTTRSIAAAQRMRVLALQLL